MVRTVGVYIFCDAEDCIWYKPRNRPITHEGREYHGNCGSNVIGVSTFPKGQWEKKLGMALGSTRPVCTHYQESMAHYRKRGGP